MNPPLASGVRLVLEIEEDGDFNVLALCGGRHVGWAYCSRQGKRLIIHEIHVAERHAIRWPMFHRLLVWLGYIRFVSFRHRGIGSRVLERVLAEAKADGVDEVWGSVTADDIGRSPFLLQWYGRHGFTVSDADGECIATAVKKVVCKIR